jgi:hypothetical protein
MTRKHWKLLGINGATVPSTVSTHLKNDSILPYFPKTKHLAFRKEGTLFLRQALPGFSYSLPRRHIDEDHSVFANPYSIRLALWLMRLRLVLSL